jgi:hypothetical protein
MTVHAGRRLKVTYTGPSGVSAVLTDSIVGPATTPLGVAAVMGAKPFLHADVDITRHLRPIAQPSSAIIKGLSRERLERICAEVAQARELSYDKKALLKAGRLRIEYGLADKDLELLADDVITNAQPRGQGIDTDLVLEAVDGRQDWDCLFITESGKPTPDNFAGHVGITAPPPAPPKKVRSVTYSLQGAGEADAVAAFARLGLAPVYTADGVRYITTGGALLLPPVDLSNALLPPIAPPGSGGLRKIRTLADPGLLAGRQVFLAVPPKPHRIVEVQLSLSNYRPVWFAVLSVQPST